ncbi:heavy metal-responsive transcriptional regulator [Metabacillus fastidiosus]|uniref:Heavy metal-responsive transcriptional regulator n=1 Tax=Metabacillus fastidiosus TaxID=1458 RepID=A0ABU6P3H1_9BACI|nr:heavy metal-responsive transcriptional regulator [Metabacillus fastidiosus]MED4403573.1 heavy metal-responsive transcriptional regulator [Metabacillus fastidiosus]MED4452366.1 heavy metal-responsive transcriptional regulator [Metabacillus fastidiosus]MED4463701.1 heavy metal-responsive transcriptional regulator [Metabacillus fastidiosus]
MNYYTISEVAKITNVNVATVRYYEKRGLVDKPTRNESGYRMFSDEVIENIKLIKQTQSLGFTLEEIKKILAIYKTESYFPAEEMYNFSVEKIGEIEEKITQLNRLKALLQAAVHCAGSELPLTKSSCPIIKILSKGEM